MTGFGSRLREAMDAKSWTAYRLWKESGVSQQHIGRLLRGERTPENLTQATLLALAEALEVRPDWLIQGTGQMRAERTPRLRERPEWAVVAATVLAEHPELESADLERLGDALDDPVVFSGRLDAPLVYSLALAIREWARRLRRV